MLTSVYFHAYSDHMDEVIWLEAQSGCEAARDELALRYAALANYVVGQLRSGIPSWVETEDLRSYATLGLLDAIQRFDPSRGVRFTTYATRRIRGHVLDELRKLDWAPRSLRPSARQVATAHEALQVALQRNPTPQELAERLGWAPERVDKVLAGAQQAAVTSIDALSTGSLEEEPRATNEISVPSLGEEAMLESEIVQRVAQGLELLEPQERALMALYYFEGVKFGDIAELLGVSESWVCIMWARAIGNLRCLTTI
jgi:RNA polymerase sigma factor FliA